MTKEKLETLLKWGLGMGAIGLGGFVALFLLQSLVTIAALGIGVLAVVHGAPVIAQRFATWKMSAVKYIAENNPVETMELIYQQQHANLQSAIAELKSFAGDVKTFEDKVESIARKYPEEAKDFQEQLVNMKFQQQASTEAIREAEAALAELQRATDKARDLWEMAKASEEMDRKSGKLTNVDPMTVIREKVAMDAVTKRVNTSMASLQVKMELSRPGQAALTNNPSPMLVDNVVITEKEKAK